MVNGKTAVYGLVYITRYCLMGNGTMLWKGFYWQLAFARDNINVPVLQPNIL